MHIYPESVSSLLQIPSRSLASPRSPQKHARRRRARMYRGRSKHRRTSAHPPVEGGETIIKYKLIRTVSLASIGLIALHVVISTKNYRYGSAKAKVILHELFKSIKSCFLRLFYLGLITLRVSGRPGISPIHLSARDPNRFAIIQTSAAILIMIETTHMEDVPASQQS